MLNLIQTKKFYSKDFIDLVNVHFEKLTTNRKLVIFFYIQENFTFDEISEILDLPIESIRTKIYSGLNQIKDSLRKEGVTASLSIIWNILEITEKVKAPDYFGDINYLKSIDGKHFSLNKSFKQMAPPLSNPTFQTNFSKEINLSEVFPQ